jgi:SP family sugar:H+ symporter-like MFS transporter
MDDFKMRFAQGPDANGEYKFSVVREGLVVALLSIGTLIGKSLSRLASNATEVEFVLGALVGRYASDIMGRRKAIVLFCLLFSVGVIIQGEIPDTRA